MKNKQILISGAGIAGLTLAYWLKEYGFKPTVIENHVKIREGGYLIDFFGLGVNVAEKMGILPGIKERDIPIREITFVDKSGNRDGGLNFNKMRSLLGNRAYNLLRSDLSQVIYAKIEEQVDFIFGASIANIVQTEENVKITFDDGRVQHFDLLIGADGLHSNVRTLVFGGESMFVKYYGYYTASYTIDNYLQNQSAFMTHSIPGKQVGIYSVRQNKLATLFLFTCPERIRYDRSKQSMAKSILFERFEKMKWECPHLLARINTANDFYFDEVSQVQMTKWSSGRISLVGDACDCPSLLSGQGSTLAMVGSYILAGELWQAEGDYAKAFSEYEKQFRPFITKKQITAQTFAGSFLPKSRLSLWARNTFINLMFLPIVSKWFIKKFMTDNLRLKTYAAPIH